MTAETFTITNGALCMDGGSVFLECEDAAGRSTRLSLDWSIAAQRSGSTSLSVDGTKVVPHSSDEHEWIERLRIASVAGSDEAAPSSAGTKRIIFAPDAKDYFAAIDRGPRAALIALRDDVIRKLMSPQRKQKGLPNQAVDPTPGDAHRKSRSLPLP